MVAHLQSDVHDCRIDQIRSLGCIGRKQRRAGLADITSHYQSLVPGSKRTLVRYFPDEKATGEQCDGEQKR